MMEWQWGRVVIKMAGHAPFGAQVILNGHEYVAIAAQGEGIGFIKEGNCFTEIPDPAGAAQIADTLSQDAAAGRLGQVIDRWIYTACLVFGLDLADQQRTCFTYAYSVYQAEYSRNLLFAYGGHMDKGFNPLLDPTRSRLGIPGLRALFPAPRRPGHDRPAPSPPVGAARARPARGRAAEGPGGSAAAGRPPPREGPPPPPLPPRPPRLHHPQLRRQHARRPAPAHPPLLSARFGRPDHIGAAHPPGPGHCPDPGRRQDPPARPCPDQADPPRPGLRTSPNRHGHPVPPPGHPATPSRGIALRQTKLLEIMKPQAASSVTRAPCELPT